MPISMRGGRRGGFGFRIQRTKVFSLFAGHYRSANLRRFVERLRERVAMLTVGDPAPTRTWGR